MYKAGVSILMLLCSGLLPLQQLSADEASQAKMEPAAPSNFVMAVAEARRRIAVIEPVWPNNESFVQAATGVFVDRDGGVITSISSVAGAEEIYVKRLSSERRRASIHSVEQSLGLVFLNTPVAFEIPFQDAEQSPVPGEWLMVTYAASFESGSDHEMGLFPALVASTDNYIDFFGQRSGPMLKLSSRAPDGSATAPVFNSKGHLEGIVMAVRDCSSASECSYVLGVEELNEIAERLREGHSRRMGWLGVVLEKAPDLQEGGVKIAAVMHDCPASRAGLKPGDIVVSIEGQQMNDPGLLQSLIGNSEPGEEVDVVIERDGDIMEFSVRLDARPFAISAPCHPGFLSEQ